MANRHIVEGNERIARQKALITELTRSGQHRLLPRAENALAVMMQLQETARQRLQQIEEADRLTHPE
jgi:hypothetical protein